MSAREDILGRVRAALTGASPEHDPISSPPGVAFTGEAMVARFAERVEDYRATVQRCSADDLAAAVADAVPQGASVVVPAGLATTLGFEVPGAGVDDQHTALELDQIEVVVTAARVGIAETGTIVLDHADDQGRRAISLVPDLHVCVIRSEQIVPDVPDALALLDPARPLTWISGPSATSDIELDRVEGVHGPRTLHVLLVD